MKTKAKVHGEVRDCFIMGARMAKLSCAVNTAYQDVGVRRGDYAKFQLRHAVADAYELGMLHRPKKKQFDQIAVELRHLSRYMKDDLSLKSSSKFRDKLNKIGGRIVDLHAGVKARCQGPA